MPSLTSKEVFFNLLMKSEMGLGLGGGACVSSGIECLLSKLRPQVQRREGKEGGRERGKKERKEERERENEKERKKERKRKKDLDM
jgi:hypothetical protein